jgi:hypothetical protein
MKLMNLKIIILTPSFIINQLNLYIEINQDNGINL